MHWPGRLFHFCRVENPIYFVQKCDESCLKGCNISLLFPEKLIGFRLLPDRPRPEWTTIAIRKACSIYSRINMGILRNFWKRIFAGISGNVALFFRNKKEYLGYWVFFVEYRNIYVFRVKSLDDLMKIEYIFTAILKTLSSFYSLEDSQPSMRWARFEYRILLVIVHQRTEQSQQRWLP